MGLAELLDRPLNRLPDANRGRSRKGIRPDGKRSTIVEFKSECAPADLLGITFDARVEGNNETTRPVRDAVFLPKLTGVLRWGVGGTTNEAEIDVLNGTTLALDAEACIVDVAYDVLYPSWLKPSPNVVCALPCFTVGASFGYGQIARSSNPARLTKLVGIQEAGASFVLQVPQYALSWTAMISLGTSADVLGYGFGAGLPIRYALTNAPLTTAGQRNLENNFPIWGGERFLEFANTGTTPLVAIVVFGLSL